MFFSVRRFVPAVVVSLFTALSGCTLPDRLPTLVDGGPGPAEDGRSGGNPTTDARLDLSVGDGGTPGDVSLGDAVLGDGPRDGFATDVSRDGLATDGTTFDGTTIDGPIIRDVTTTCIPGAMCVPANSCHQGEAECTDGGATTCRDTSRSQANGTPCDKGVCLDGTCQACAAGTMCDVTNKPCRVGTVVCTTGAPVCTETDNKPNGSSCGAGQVCQEGICKPCVTGEACTPTNACHVGRLDCSGPAPTCTDTGMNIAPGATCGQDKVCDSAGTCIACVAGSTCPIASNPCRTGTTACSTGAPVCIESGNTPNGVSCGPNKVCSGGACVVCTAGTTCVPANPCHNGTQVCSPAVECTDNGSAVTDGTSCGTDKVCSGGTCTTCAANKTCSPSNACRVGTTSCSTGVSVCNETGNQNDGVSCGTNQVCSKGVCGACTMGAPCTPTANPCHAGTLNCSSGTPVCTDTGVSLMDGETCGSDLVCRGGMCVSCQAGGACQPTDLCKTGTYSCATGSRVCVNTGNKAPGEDCDTGKVCSPSGICSTCDEGGVCTPTSNRCHKGTLSCATGAAVCNDTGAAQNNGTNCGTDSVCFNGMCTGCIAGGTCPVANPCKNSAWSCDTGQRVCNETTNKAQGTSCGSQFCTNSQQTSATTCNASGVCLQPTVTPCANGCIPGGNACLNCNGLPACAGTCCTANQGCCGTTCTALDNTTNCGTCGNACAPSQVCNAARQCETPTWCKTVAAPGGVAAQDYQCLDFDTGMPPANVWAPITQTISGTIGLATDFTTSAPNSFAAFCPNADEADPASLAPIRALTWSASGTRAQSMSVIADIYPRQPHGLGTGYVNYLCISLGNAKACISYGVSIETSPNASALTITTTAPAAGWCGVSFVPAQAWTRIHFNLNNAGVAGLVANGQNITCSTGGAISAGNATVTIGVEGIDKGYFGQVNFDNLQAYILR